MVATRLAFSPSGRASVKPLSGFVSDGLVNSSRKRGSCRTIHGAEAIVLDA
jgi:hypothetical protein